LICEAAAWPVIAGPNRVMDNMANKNKLGIEISYPNGWAAMLINRLR